MNALAGRIELVYNEKKGYFIMLQQDYHVHCLNSPDSSEPLEEICKGALEAGLTEIMVTDHYEMFHDGNHRSHRPAYRPEYMNQCMKSVMECRARFGDRLYVGFGIELGQWQLQPQAAARIVREYPLDYVIASYHKMNDVDLKEYTYTELDIGKLRHQYLEELLEIVQTADFDCLGHLDLVKRYAAAQNVVIRVEEEEELVREILRTLAMRQKGLELNTSGLRQAAGETFPSLTILRWYREAGGTVITVGSDAHCRKDVAADFGTALKLMEAVGFTEIACFRKRRQIMKRTGDM